MEKQTNRTATHNFGEGEKKFKIQNRAYKLKWTENKIFNSNIKACETSHTVKVVWNKIFFEHTRIRICTKS